MSTARPARPHRRRVRRRLAAQARGARAVPRPAAALRRAVGGAQLRPGPALAPRARRRGRAARRRARARRGDRHRHGRRRAARARADCTRRRHRPERGRCSPARARASRRRASRASSSIEGEAEALPFARRAASTRSRSPTCCATSTIRAATMRELARVVRPGGRVASLEFGVPPCAAARAGVAPVHRGRAAGCSAASPRASGRGRALPRPEHPRLLRARTRCERIVGYWRAGRARGRARAAHEPRRRRRDVGASARRGRPVMRAAPRAPGLLRARRGRLARAADAAAPAVHAWHLSYFALGAAPRRTSTSTACCGGSAAFALAVGVAAHALDELHDRPLGHRLSATAR